jgi:hypothetical protein
MVTLTIINSLVLIYLLIKGNKSYYMTLKKDYSDKIFLGYTFTLWRRTSYGAKGIFVQQFSFVNREFVKLRQEVNRMKNDKYNQVQTLHAKFSWLRTHQQVAEFVKNYREVNPDVVDQLVTDFKPKKD